MKPIKTILTLIACLAALTACQTDPLTEDQGQEIKALQLTTRTNEGGQTYTNGSLTLVINTGEAQPVELKYYYTPSTSDEWELYSGTVPQLLNGKEYPAYAYGGVNVAWGETYEETIPVTWTGPLTPVVTGTGTAQAGITLTPATSCFHITLKGAYGETEPLTGFYVRTPEVKIRVLENGDFVWENLPAGTDPYTTPRTLKLNQYEGSWELFQSLQSRADYPAGQTIDAGETLFELWARTDDTKQLYGDGVKYTVLAPSGGLTLEPGKRYNYTLRLDGLSHTATIETATISDFADGASIPHRNYRGIASAKDLVDFAKEFNLNSTAAMKRWADEETSTIIRLLNDIDMNNTTDFEMIGDAYNAFPGTFDGQGHTIANLKVKTTDMYAGMFCNITLGATVKNLHLRKANIEATGDWSAGGIVARTNNGTISSCTVHGEVTGSYANGIAYQNYSSGKIIACGFEGTLTSSDNSTAGITYSNYGTITGCYALTEGGALFPIAWNNPSYDGTITGCIGKDPKIDGLLEDVDIATMNNAIYNEGTELHWIRKSEKEMEVMPGKKNVPIYITTAAELLAFANDWNAGDGEKWIDGTGTVYLGADITLTEEWPMIYDFTATFDGGGHKVSGVKGAGAYGFFYVIADGATVKNLIVDVEFDNTNSAIGGIAYNNAGTITSCGVHGTINGAYASGIACWNYNTGKITGCYSVAKVTDDGTYGSGSGGIVYYSEGTITDCFWYRHPDGNADYGIYSPSQSDTGAAKHDSEAATIAAWNTWKQGN